MDGDVGSIQMLAMTYINGMNTTNIFHDFSQDEWSALGAEWQGKLAGPRMLITKKGQDGRSWQKCQSGQKSIYRDNCVTLQRSANSEPEDAWSAMGVTEEGNAKGG
jgi:hypothetical protein